MSYMQITETTFQNLRNKTATNEDGAGEVWNLRVALNLWSILLIVVGILQEERNLN